jgi:uroporphyrinogen-III synthase
LYGQLVLVRWEPANSSLAAGWVGVTIYVVGEKTACSLRDIFSRLTNIDPGLIDIRGQESGNATNLATLILSDLHGASGTKLLYLTGDKNRDTITRMLSEEKVELERLQVYRTQESSSFESRLSSVLETASKGAWFFSPSFLHLSFNDLIC